MLQTVDFLNFPEELLFETHRASDRVFDRVVQCRNFSHYFTKKWFRYRSSPSNFAKLENSQEIFPVESVFSVVIDSKLDSEVYPLKMFFWKLFMTCFF